MNGEAVVRAQTLALLWQIAMVAAEAMKHTSAGTDDTEGDLAGVVNYTLNRLHTEGRLTAFQAESLGNALTEAAKEAMYYGVYLGSLERFAKKQDAALKETQAAVPDYGTVAFQLN